MIFINDKVTYLMTCIQYLLCYIFQVFFLILLYTFAVLQLLTILDSLLTSCLILRFL